MTGNEKEEIVQEFLKLKHLLPNCYAKTVEQKIKGHCTTHRIYKVASAKVFDSQILLVLIELCEEEKERLEIIKQKIKCLT